MLHSILLQTGVQGDERGQAQGGPFGLVQSSYSAHCIGDLFRSFGSELLLEQGATQSRVFHSVHEVLGLTMLAGLSYRPSWRDT